MKRLVAIPIGLLGATILLVPAKAADANIRLAEQSCEAQAAKKKLTGAEKDSFISKCQQR
jgi:hypothetical protein